MRVFLPVHLNSSYASKEIRIIVFLNLTATEYPANQNVSIQATSYMLLNLSHKLKSPRVKFPDRLITDLLLISYNERFNIFYLNLS